MGPLLTHSWHWSFWYLSIQRACFLQTKNRNNFRSGRKQPSWFSHFVFVSSAISSLAFGKYAPNTFCGFTHPTDYIWDLGQVQCMASLFSQFVNCHFFLGVEKKMWILFQPNVYLRHSSKLSMNGIKYILLSRSHMDGHGVGKALCVSCLVGGWETACLIMIF